MDFVNINNAISNYGKMDTFSGITTTNGITTVTADIGGKRYSARLPYGSVVSMCSNYITENGQRNEELRITVNCDTALYRTENGKTVVYDGSENIRVDGGPFHINFCEDLTVLLLN
ncbi:hypothetical protein KIN20_001618 [Parelaphostrongylus tenuis]|uniref:Uncharacterized protein n=1 Tax=Parelaphostrongylus tenuis TaxID=148309 RepID=A0AAD5MME1_PARTN|nr:hypothetical protein KIN20_001618 [Parelaphostrongylus tenuis]